MKRRAYLLELPAPAGLLEDEGHFPHTFRPLKMKRNKMKEMERNHRNNNDLNSIRAKLFQCQIKKNVNIQWRKLEVICWRSLPTQVLKTVEKLSQWYTISKEEERESGNWCRWTLFPSLKLLFMRRRRSPLLLLWTKVWATYSLKVTLNKTFQILTSWFNRLYISTFMWLCTFCPTMADRFLVISL